MLFRSQIIRAFLEDSGEWKDDLDKFNWGEPIYKEKLIKNETTPCFKGYETKFFQPSPDTKFLNEKIVLVIFFTNSCLILNSKPIISKKKTS